jgi:hypothetical protein
MRSWESPDLNSLWKTASVDSQTSIPGRECHPGEPLTPSHAGEWQSGSDFQGKQKGPTNHFQLDETVRYSHNRPIIHLEIM